MPKTKSVIRPEVKDQILIRLKNEGIPVSQLASDHGISPRTIYSWLEHGASSHPNLLELSKLKKRNRVLSELLGQVVTELALLKKSELTKELIPAMAGKLSKKALAHELARPRSTLYYRRKLPAKDLALLKRYPPGFTASSQLWLPKSSPSAEGKRQTSSASDEALRSETVPSKGSRKPLRNLTGLQSGYPNLIKSHFPSSANQIWVSDFTYLPYRGYFVYLATVIDLYDRQVVG